MNNDQLDNLTKNFITDLTRAHQRIGWLEAKHQAQQAIIQEASEELNRLRTRGIDEDLANVQDGLGTRSPSLEDALRELKFGRPAVVQKVLDRAIKDLAAPAKRKWRPAKK